MLCSEAGEQAARLSAGLDAVDDPFVRLRLAPRECPRRLIAPPKKHEQSISKTIRLLLTLKLPR